jgi:hypothetical protein
MVRFKRLPVKSFLERPHARQTVISRSSVTPWLAFLYQDGHLPRDQPRPVHAGLHPRLSRQQPRLSHPIQSRLGPRLSTDGSVVDNRAFPGTNLGVVSFSCTSMLFSKDPPSGGQNRLAQRSQSGPRYLPRGWWPAYLAEHLGIRLAHRSLDSHGRPRYRALGATNPALSGDLLIGRII